jgi:hypothetical protein
MNAQRPTRLLKSLVGVGIYHTPVSCESFTVKPPAVTGYLTAQQLGLTDRRGTKEGRKKHLQHLRTLLADCRHSSG